MTDFRKTLLAGAAGLALMAGPALAEGTYGEEPAARDMQTEGAVEMEGATGMDSSAAATDATAQLEALGYTDVEPVEAQGDAAVEGEGYYTATNPDGNRVTIQFDEEAGTVIGEQPAE